MRKGFHEPNEKPRRFYKQVTVGEAAGDPGGFTVLLDSRHLSAPKGTRLVLPTRAVADQVAAEWAAQNDVIALGYMHATRLANTAVEAIPASRDAVAQSVADYAGSDLLCYLADKPEGLVASQRAAWDPILAWAAEAEGLAFVRSVGIVHAAQPAATLARVKAIALEQDDFGLAGLAFGASLLGSAVLTLAVLRGRLGGAAAFDLSRVDEDWQERQWGVDLEAAERTARLRGEAMMLERWFKALASAA